MRTTEERQRTVQTDATSKASLHRPPIWPPPHSPGSPGGQVPCSSAFPRISPGGQSPPTSSAGGTGPAREPGSIKLPSSLLWIPRLQACRGLCAQSANSLHRKRKADCSVLYLEAWLVLLGTRPFNTPICVQQFQRIHLANIYRAPNAVRP